MNNNLFKKQHPIPDADNVYDIDIIEFGTNGLVLSLIPDDIDHFIKGSVLFPENPMHFLIRGTNFIVDIISISYPDVTISSL